MEASVATPVADRQAASPFAGIGRHLSHSQVSTFDKCELCWYLKYVRGIEKPPTIPMVLGQCYHKSLALNFTQKRITGEDLQVEEVVSCFTESFDQTIREGSIDAPYGVDANSYRDPVVRLLRHYYSEYVVGKMEPILVEHEMVCAIPGCDRLFAGIVDVQLSDGTMIDFKVSSRRWSDADVAGNTQATGYAMLCGYDTDFEFHIGLRANKNPALQIVRTRRTGTDVEQFVVHLKDVLARMRDMEEGRVEPTPKAGYCNEKMCQLYQECCDWKYGA